jgi:hypothetical protein
LGQLPILAMHADYGIIGGVVLLEDFMPRRIKTKETKRDWRYWASMVLNGAVVVSMVLGTIFVFAGVPSRSLPTQSVPTAGPSIAAPPTAVPPSVVPSVTPTPKSSLYFEFVIVEST